MKENDGTEKRGPCRQGTSKQSHWEKTEHLQFHFMESGHCTNGKRCPKTYVKPYKPDEVQSFFTILIPGRYGKNGWFKRGEWWRWPGSNRRPPRCERGALPAELHPHLKNAARPCLSSRKRIRNRRSLKLHLYSAASVFLPLSPEKAIF